MVDEGNLVRASDVGIVMITEIKPIAVIFTLPQQQLAQINAAQARGPVTVEALDADGKTVLDRGMLQVVDNQVDQTTGTVRMKAEFPNTPTCSCGRASSSTCASWSRPCTQVVIIPTPAVQRGPNGTFAYVVQADQRVGLRPITVGLQTETTAVITKGIAATERVVTTGFSRLKDGARVVRAARREAARRRRRRTSRRPSRPPSRKRARRCARPAPPTSRSSAPMSSAARSIRACLQANAAKLSEACKAAGAGQKGGQATGSRVRPTRARPTAARTQ